MANEYKGRVTAYVIFACIVAATGGLTFGYAIGVSGGVTSMNAFLKKFFPVVYRDQDIKRADSNYCKYNNQKLAAFTSSLYITGLFSTFLAGWFTKKYGRKPSIIVGGFTFLLGSILNAAAQNMAMLIIGRILLGVGVGFGNQAVPLYLSEMAPLNLRGALNCLFQLAVTIGIFIANLVNYGTNKIDNWGWRLSLGLAAVPAILMFVGGVFLPDTPNSLIERKRYEEGKRILKKIRGTEEVDAEYDDIVEASRKSEMVKSPFKTIMMKKSRPQLIITMLMPFFQQFSGINAIMFYAPVLFKTIGFGGDASLYSAVITGAVNVLSTLVSVFCVDKFGRRALLLEAGWQMTFAHAVIGAVLGAKLKGDNDLAKGWAMIVVVVICIYVAGFAWSWGPLAWLVPSEVFPMETRSAGQSINVFINLLFTFLIAQTFLSMLCSMKWAIFIFFCVWVVIMTIFVYFFVPETKGIPIEEMSQVWRKHWFWKRLVPAEDAPVLPKTIEMN